MIQKDLFGEVKPLPPWCRGAPTTSKDAAKSVAPAGKQLREVVFQALKERGAEGATLEELEAITGLSGSTLRPRLWELRGENRKAPMPVRVRDGGERRRTSSGRQAVVWVAE